MALPVSATNVTWEPLGPAGGDQLDVVISPNDPKHHLYPGAFCNTLQYRRGSDMEIFAERGHGQRYLSIHDDRSALYTTPVRR